MLELSGGVRSLPQAPWWNAGRRARAAGREPRPYGAEVWTKAPAGVPLPFIYASNREGSETETEQMFAV